jgi:uncharacterized membrane protein
MSEIGVLVASVGFENIERPWLWVILVLVGAGILVATYHSMLRRSERRHFVLVLLLLRAAGLFALLLALAKPTWTRTQERVDAGRVAIVLDNSLSMSLADPSGPTRYELACKAVEQVRTQLRAAGPGQPMELDLFDINGAPLSGGPPDQPRVEHTDLLRAVKETRSRLRSRPLGAIVLVTDGMDNSGRQDFHELADTDVPIHTLGFRPDPESSTLDFAVRGVQAPPRALVHNEIKIEVVAAKTSGPATQATVSVQRGREVFATQPVAFGPGSSEQRVSLKFTPRQAGNFVITASIASPAGERQVGNNRLHFPLRVDAEAIRVLYVEGFLRYEYKFLKNRLEEDPDVSLVSVVRRANPGLASAKADALLITSERLKNFDVVLLGDMEAGYLSEAEYRALGRWVEEGHALLVLGGYHSFGLDGFRATPLANLLPVVFAEKEPFQSEEPFTLTLTEEGQRHPVFEVTSAAEKMNQFWNTAPPLLGCSLVQRAKPGASILAINPTVTQEGRPAIVVAAQRYGSGHTMVLAADTTWRWTRLTRVLGQSDTLYARFWSQTLRWLAGRDQKETRPLLSLSTDRPSYEVGKPVTIRLARQPRPDLDLANSMVRVEVMDESGKDLSIPVQSGTAEPNSFTGTFYPAAGGRYEVAATLHVGDKPLANQTTEFIVQGSDLELANPGTNRSLLQEIASTTGGLYFDLDDAGNLADKIERKERRVTQVQRTELWNSPGLFLFFLGAITGEWLLRRKNHLV